MSKIEIDFNDLKYNLYEILNVPIDAPEIKIKKSFMKLVKNFHPDKNLELEEEIYYHIILSNQILLNKESRAKYNVFLQTSADTFKELKDTFNKNIKNIEQNFSNKELSLNEYIAKNEILNKKHNEQSFIDTNHQSVLERFEKLKTKRNDINIIKENINNDKEFNTKFENNKIDGKFKDQIIEYVATGDLTTYISGDVYTSLSDMDKLYLEDSVQNVKYSSLDRAFTLQPCLHNDDLKKSIDVKMKDYQFQTEFIKNMKPTEFSNVKFNNF
jgi:curved DNA-binding protein CbpA